MHDLMCPVVILPLWMLTGSDRTLDEGASGHLRTASSLTLTTLTLELNHWDRSVEVESGGRVEHI